MKCAGFTLVELLVIIAVIAILIAILLPVLNTARQQSQAIACGSNLKQLGWALTIYEQENRTFPYGFDDSAFGTVIPPGGYPGDASRDLQGSWWFHSLIGILGENFGEGSILWCPSRSVKEPYILCGNYGANRAICRDALSIMGGEFAGAPLDLDLIRRPAETLLLTDSGYSLISWRGATNMSGHSFENIRREGAFYIPGLRINNERTILPECEWDAINGRHPNKTVNVVFADGHVSRLKADDLLVEKIEGKYHNRSPLWLPE
jgi:prepilin-type processing-associated H-X9-DG protein